MPTDDDLSKHIRDCRDDEDFLARLAKRMTENRETLARLAAGPPELLFDTAPR